MPDLSPPHHRVKPGMPLAGDQEPNKLVLCFDGTGNTFSGSNADTNVVKILNKLDRHCPQQYHYYQTGVGTYDINEKSVNKTWLGEMRSSVSQTLDQAFGTTFDHHVMAGYRFLMRYYEPGDKIYMFGFSRGAFTAKFLARMIHTVGLLCRGNEEMVPFAFRLYQRYLAGEFEDFAHSHSTGRSHSSERRSDGDTDPILKTLNQQQQQHQHHGHTYESARNEVVAFSNTFCQQLPTSTGPDADGHIVYENIKVYFLGIWDCVNSVAVLERNAPMPVPVKGTAQFVRHAVAVDERRVKFKPALMAQDIRCASAEHSNQEDIKEVWFPGCHGDVGGGWPAGEGDHLDAEESTSTTGAGISGWWGRFKAFWRTRRAKEATADIRKDPFQMSDVALSWMIRELEMVGERDPRAAVKWSCNVDGYKRALARETSQKQALKGFMHDSLAFGQGTGFFTVLFWKFMEFLPIITRWELNNTQWEKVRFPLNKGSYRDIPRDAVLHESLVHRLRTISDYRPRNNHGGRLEPCLKNKGGVPDFRMVRDERDETAKGHRTFVFPSSE